MKYTVTSLNYPNEMVMFSRCILDNVCFKTFFGEIETDLSPHADSYKQSELLHSNHIDELNCTLVDCSIDASVDCSHCTLVNSSFTKYCT